MNRYHSPRRASSTPAGPIVAFLLIACFGLLFVTGCTSSETVETTEDDTFTAEDVERFRALSERQEASTGTGAAAVAMSEGASISSISSSAASALPAPVTIDPALRKTYDAYRAGSSGAANAYRVTNAFLNVRAQPNVSAAFVARLDQGDIVTLVEFTNAAWAKVALPGGTSGYVASRYLSKLTTEEKLNDEQKVYAGQYFVNFAFVNVRSAPSTGADKIAEIPGQAFVKPLSIEKDWARVAVDGKEGYVSMQYLSLFTPNFLVRQQRYDLPILRYAVDQPGMLDALKRDVASLKGSGVRFLTMRDFFEIIQTQEIRDVRISPRSVILAVTGVTAGNVQQVSEAMAGTRATIFLQTDQIGLSGISEKTILTLQANGLDIQSAGHTGDDLRTLTAEQTQLELGQSRTLLEDITHKTVFAVAYPQGGANDRVLTAAADAGYLFGIGTAPDTLFTRDQFLRLPSYMVTAGMSAEDVLTITK